MSKQKRRFSTLQDAGGLQPPEAKSNVIYSVPELIRQLLETINMYEGTDVAHTETMVLQLREIHLDLKNLIAIHPDYQDNVGLQKLDKAYKDSGWDNNGLRWTKEHIYDDAEDVFIVEFTNMEHTTWKIA